MTTNDNIIRLGDAPAYALEAGDQIIIEGDLFIIDVVDQDRPDIDEVFVTGENLSGGEDSFALFADDDYTLWAI